MRFVVEFVFRGAPAGRVTPMDLALGQSAIRTTLGYLAHSTVIALLRANRAARRERSKTCAAH